MYIPMFGLGQNLDAMRKSECTKENEDSDFICLKMIEPMISKQNTNELLVIWPKKAIFPFKWNIYTVHVQSKIIIENLIP